MMVYLVVSRVDTYYDDTIAIFSDIRLAEQFAQRLRDNEDDDTVYVQMWAVNTELPEWDGEA